MFEFIIFLIIIVSTIAGYLAYKKVSTIKDYIEPNDLIILQVRVPKELEKTDVKTAPVAADRLYSSLHGLLNTSPDSSYEVLNFEIYASGKGIVFYVSIPDHIRNFVESQIYANYPGAQIEKVDDYILNIDPESQIVLNNLVLSKKSFFPIKTFKDFDVDPLGAITEALTEVSGSDIVCMHFL